MAEELTEITDHSVFKRPNEIIVELRGHTADGEFTVTTYQFDLDQNEEEVQLRGSIERAHEETVRDILADAGYALT